MSDILHFTRPHCVAGGERLMRLADVVQARQEASPRPSWGAIMLKAFALAARNHVQLRQAFFEFPWGHIGEYETQVGCMVMPRRVADEDVIVLAPIATPESQSLLELDAALRGFQEKPVEEIRAFREALSLAKLPRLISRFLLWLTLHVLPRRRVRHFGTFCVTAMMPFGAKHLALPTVGVPILHYGAMTETGDVPVGLVIDHRVMDGAVVGYVLMEMEQILHHAIRAELAALRAARAAA